MPKPYSDDLRERVIEAIVAGASRREARRKLQPERQFGGEVVAALA
jgi:hypothetical protein